MTVVRIYLRRSKADKQHQEFSLDVQRHGSDAFAATELPRRGIATATDKIEYVDDDRAGDDFLGRASLQRLLEEVQPGNVVVCRDQSRLGRDALETTLVVRTLIRDKRARLFYYATGEEVAFASAVDQATTFIKGTAHQMELEAIRSRTREALRARVRAGRVAGGRCFGYTLVRMTDESGREYTIARINETEAKVVQSIFLWYLDGWGLRRIAIKLNHDRVPSPRAGSRGTGSWAPSTIRAMLRNERYRGVYVHGRMKRTRAGGRRIATKAPESEWVQVEIPEWRIIEDETWAEVRAGTERRSRNTTAPGPAAKYALTGIARCGHCGGSIGVRKTRASLTKRVNAYGCTWHHGRGNSVCPVAVLQPIDEVEGILVDYLQKTILTPVLVERVVREIQAEIDRQMAATPADTAKIETDIKELRRQAKNLVRLGAMAEDDDIPELALELKQVNARVRELQAELRVAHRVPEELQSLMSRVQKSAEAKLDDLREALQGDRDALREVFRVLFPDGLTFTPAPENRKRRVFAISGRAKLDVSKLSSDPTGT